MVSARSNKSGSDSPDTTSQKKHGGRRVFYSTDRPSVTSIASTFSFGGVGGLSVLVTLFTKWLFMVVTTAVVVEVTVAVDGGGVEAGGRGAAALTVSAPDTLTCLLEIRPISARSTPRASRAKTRRTGRRIYRGPGAGIDGAAGVRSTGGRRFGRCFGSRSELPINDQTCLR